MKTTAIARWAPLSSLKEATERYFFREGFELQLGMCRVFLFSAVLLSAINQIALFNAFGWPSDWLRAHVEYNPFGILILFGKSPPNWLIDASAVVAPIAGILAVIGFLTRPAMIVATISTIILVCVREGIAPYWSHGYNLIFYCALPFMFSRAGASLSIDRAIWKRRPSWSHGRPVAPGEASWPVVAGLVAACAFFYGAFWAKLYWGGPIAWWDSDNMRFSLAVTWLGYDVQNIPWYVETMWSSPFLYKAADLFHLFLQAAPIAALFSLRRPYARLVEGVFYSMSTLGLGFIMGLWQYHWLFIGCFFIDWDYFRARFAGAVPPSTESSDLKLVAYRRLIIVGLALFLGAIHVMFLLQIRRGTVALYPLSALDFYASVRAETPYDEHRGYHDYRCEYALRYPTCEAVGLPDEGTPAASKPLGRRDFSCSGGEVRLRHFNIDFASYCWRAGSPEALRTLLGKALDLTGYLPQAATRRMPWRYSAPMPRAMPIAISLRQQRIEYPAYPAAPDPIIRQEGLKAILASDGTMKAVSGRIIRDDETKKLALKLDVAGLSSPELTVEYKSRVMSASQDQPSRAAPGRWRGTTFLLDEDAIEKPAYLTVKVREKDGAVHEFYDVAWWF